MQQPWLQCFEMSLTNWLPITADRYHVVSLPSSSTEWCNAGASTNLDHYKDWLRRTIEYLDSSFSKTITNIKEKEIKPRKETVKPRKEQTAVIEATAADDEEVEENNSCSTDPCGSHALCWNGDGASYLCTCQPDHPHGNLYTYTMFYLMHYHKKVQWNLMDSSLIGLDLKLNYLIGGKNKAAPQELVQSCWC